MKLTELINVLLPEADITFEIKEETRPTGLYAKEILEKYPHAKNYEVISIEPAIAYLEDNSEPTLMIEVSNGQEESQ